MLYVDRYLGRRHDGNVDHFNHDDEEDQMFITRAQTF
jgi:hypothetical protein